MTAAAVLVTKPAPEPITAPFTAPPATLLPIVAIPSETDKSSLNATLAAPAKKPAAAPIAPPMAAQRCQNKNILCPACLILYCGCNYRF